MRRQRLIPSNQVLMPLLRWAPMADEFKEQDEEIMRNRFT